MGAGVLLGQGSDSVVRLQAAANRAASKHFDDSRNGGIAGRPMRPSPRYTVDHTTMRTFGDEQVRRDPLVEPRVHAAASIGWVPHRIRTADAFS